MKKTSVILGSSTIMTLVFCIVIGYTFYRNYQEQQAETALRKILNEQDISLYEKVVQDYPKTAASKTASQKAGIHYQKEKEYTKAIEYFHKAEKLPEPIIESARYFAISICQYELGQYKKALGAIQKALEIKEGPELKHAHFLIKVYDKIKQETPTTAEKQAIAKKQLDVAKKMYHRYKHEKDNTHAQEIVHDIKTRLEKIQQEVSNT